MTRFTTALVAGAAALAVFTGCGSANSPGATPPAGADSPAHSGSPHATAATTASPSQSHSVGTATVLRERSVALDPGHNGGNASHPAKIAKQVPDGRGGTKPCNTTGTATVGGFEEHTFNWRVATQLRDELQNAGGTVAMSRTGDKGVGPCVDERGRFAGKAGADALLSIHANGTDNSSVHGFHVIVSPTAGKPKASKRLGRAMVKELKAHGFRPNRAYGASGLSIRSDLAGLENAKVPAVIVECGEMNNRDEAAVMKSGAGQRRYAAALEDGLTRYFAR